MCVCCGVCIKVVKSMKEQIQYLMFKKKIYNIHMMDLQLDFF